MCVSCAYIHGSLRGQKQNCVLWSWSYRRLCAQCGCWDPNWSCGRGMYTMDWGLWIFPVRHTLSLSYCPSIRGQVWVLLSREASRKGDVWEHPRSPGGPWIKGQAVSETQEVCASINSVLVRVPVYPRLALSSQSLLKCRSERCAHSYREVDLCLTGSLIDIVCLWCMWLSPCSQLWGCRGWDSFWYLVSFTSWVSGIDLRSTVLKGKQFNS